MEPLVPAEVDLRDFGFMPLDVRRLLTSETWIEAADTPKVGHAAMCLWAEAWHQLPAASLPDNDKVLARLAMCDARTWAKLRPKILAGWVKCSDGLLYHPVVAEKALESWKAKCARRARTKAATEAREARKRDENSDRHVQRDVERNEQRNEQRNVARNEDRNVHQGTGTGTGTGTKEQKQKRAAGAAPADLFPGVDSGVVSDFLALRAKHRAPVTETAVAGIRREAEAAGYSLEQALRTCCERGWRGFKAEWVAREGAGNVRPFPGRPAAKPGAQPDVLPELTA